MPTKICPFCAEEIDLRAIKCKHCGSMLNTSQQNSQANEEIFRRKIIDEVEERNRVKKAHKIESYKNVGVKAVKFYVRIWMYIFIVIAILLALSLLVSLSGA